MQLELFTSMYAYRYIVVLEFIYHIKYVRAILCHSILCNNISYENSDTF